MILSWERPTRHRYVATVFGIPVASSQSYDAARGYLMLAVSGDFLARVAMLEGMPSVVDRSRIVVGRA